MDEMPSLAPAAALGPELTRGQRTALAARIENLLAHSPQRIHKLRGGADFPELPEGATIWLKRAEPPHPGGLVRLYNLAMSPVPLLRSVPNPGGSAALDNERRRLQELAALGVPVPALVAHGRDWIATADAGSEPLQARLDRLLREQNQSAILSHWKLGLHAIAKAHGCGAYLSQCFARNMVMGHHDRIYFIDFEEDPGEIMSRPQAQVRDWALYVHSTAFFLQDRQQAAAAMAAAIEPARDEVRLMLLKLMRRLRWLLAVVPDRAWLGRDIARARAAGLLLRAVLDHLEASGRA
jgi:tRNA A-37 threonylcarbamoyl transferase component Bud32